MNMLVTGTFEADTQAEQAVRKLLRACVPSNRVRKIVKGGRKRVAVRGADARTTPAERGGILVAVKATDNVLQCLALKVLREHGARDIERVHAERRARPRVVAARAPSHVPALQFPLPL